MSTFWFVILAFVGLFLIYWLRTLPFREKKNKAPEETAHARLLSRRVTTGANQTGRSSGMGYNYVLTFQLNDGAILELYSHDVEYGALREGMSGQLTWKGRYFVDLEVSALYEELACWAEEEHRSVNAQIEYLLTQCVKQRKAALAGGKEARP